MTLLGWPIEHVAKLLCRDARTVRNYLDGKTPIPAWTVRLMLLESRYMDALYGIQRDRGTGFALGLHRTTITANDPIYSTQLMLKLVI
jgi:hypothetical protein